MVVIVVLISVVFIGRGVTVFIRYLASLDGLAAGITEQRAAELCWALTDGHLYRLLVAQRSWSTADFSRWLSDGTAAYLNGPQPAGCTPVRRVSGAGGG